MIPQYAGGLPSTAYLRNGNPNWTWADEQFFIRHLGLHTSRTNGISRRDLFRLYLASIPYRHDWGLLDKEQVEKFVREEIAGEESEQ